MPVRCAGTDPIVRAGEALRRRSDLDAS